MISSATSFSWRSSVDTVGNADDLISDFFLVALLGLLAQLLLASQVQTEGKCSLVDLLHDFCLEILAGSLLLGQVKGDGGLNGLDLLGLALIHNLTGQTLGSKLLMKAGDLLVERLEFLLLRDLGTEKLVVQHLQLELHCVAAGLLLVL